MNTLKKVAYRPGFNSFFDDVFGRTAFEHQPLTNIRETEAAFEIELLAPGRQKSDFEVDLNEQLLTISAKQPEVKAEEGDKWLRREFSLSAWKRAFTLSKDSIDTEQIQAQYEDGILRLTLPKLQVKKQEIKRQISIG